MSRAGSNPNDELNSASQSHRVCDGSSSSKESGAEAKLHLDNTNATLVSRNHPHSPTSEDRSFSCWPTMFSLENLRRFGGEGLQHTPCTWQENPWTLLSTENAVDPEEIGRPGSWKAVFYRAAQDIVNTGQRVRESMKKIGIQMTATSIRHRRQSVEDGRRYDSPLQRKCYDEDSSDDASQEEYFKDSEYKNIEQKAGPDFQPFVEREEVFGSLVQSEAHGHPTSDVALDSARDQPTSTGISRESSDISRSNEVSRGRTSERSTGAYNRPRAVSSATNSGGRSTSQDEEAGPGCLRTRATSEPPARCCNCNQDPLQEADKVELRRSIGVEKKCYYCNDDREEVCLQTMRHICKNEECQERHAAEERTTAGRI